MQVNRVMLSAMHSGSGKTTITCALLEVLQRRHLNPVSFKCGPDFIDPMFHETILGIESRNLDTFFSGIAGVRSQVSRCSGRYAVIEGVMGLYDGVSVEGLAGSGYETASALGCPVVLIVDAHGIGRTILSLIRGILADDRRHLIKGVILNQAGAGFYRMLKPVLEEALMEDGYEVRVLGALPTEEGIRLESRHLGLKLPGEEACIREKIGRAADLLEQYIDVDGILDLMRSAPPVEQASQEHNQRELYFQESVSRKLNLQEKCFQESVSRKPDLRKKRFQESAYQELDQRELCVRELEFQKPMLQEAFFLEGNAADAMQAETGCSGLTLAVARDEAFCFYYRDNLELFQRRGVKLRFFSPIREDEIPDDADGLLLGGGYPELYLPELSRNHSMLTSVKDAVDRGMPSLAECGGFLYLHRTFRDTDGREYSMAGVIDGECYYTGHLVRFGYLQLESLCNPMRDWESSEETKCGACRIPANRMSESALREETEYGTRRTPGNQAPESVFSEEGNDCARDSAEEAFYKSAVGLKGHEFHYYDSTACGDACTARKPMRDTRWKCMFARNNGLWGFPHFYYPSCPQFADHFIERMGTYHRRIRRSH